MVVGGYSGGFGDDDNDVFIVYCYESFVNISFVLFFQSLLKFKEFP